MSENVLMLQFYSYNVMHAVMQLSLTLLTRSGHLS